MKIYSQKDYNQRLGTCGVTIASDGCFLVCLSMLAEIDPPTSNDLLKNGGYARGCLIVQDKACEILGLVSKGRTTTDQYTLCIAETNYYKSSGYNQHFFIYNNGMIIDPLDKNPGWKDNKYKNNMVSYRLISKPNTMYKNFTSTVAKIIDFDFGDNLNENESKKMADKIKEKFEDNEDLIKINQKQVKDIENLKKEIKEKDQTIEILQESIEDFEKDGYIFKLFGLTIRVSK